MVPGRFLVTFGHMNILQKKLNHFVVVKSRTWPPLKLIAPFITQKKIRSVYKVYGTQNDQLELGFEKYAPGSEIFTKMCHNLTIFALKP